MCFQPFSRFVTLPRKWIKTGEEKLQTLLQESLAVATRTEAMKPSDLRIVDSRRLTKKPFGPARERLFMEGPTSYA
jgi:hypothetical protein